jgi:arsenate reductase
MATTTAAACCAPLGDPGRPPPGQDPQPAGHQPRAGGRARVTEPLGLPQPTVSHHLKSSSRPGCWTASSAAPGPPPACPVTRPAPDRADAEDRAPEVLFVCVHNAQSDGRRPPRPPRQGHGPGPVGRVGAGRPAQRGGGRGHGRVGHRPVPGVPQAAHRRLGQGSRRGRLHGLRGRLPGLPGKRYEDWELQDPAGQPVEVVRRIRDDIDGRVRRLLDELVPSASA